MKASRDRVTETGGKRERRQGESCMTNRRVCLKTEALIHHASPAMSWHKPEKHVENGCGRGSEGEDLSSFHLALGIVEKLY